MHRSFEAKVGAHLGMRAPIDAAGRPAQGYDKELRRFNAKRYSFDDEVRALTLENFKLAWSEAELLLIKRDDLDVVPQYEKGPSILTDHIWNGLKVDAVRRSHSMGRWTALDWYNNRFEEEFGGWYRGSEDDARERASKSLANGALNLSPELATELYMARCYEERISTRDII